MFIVQVGEIRLVDGHSHSEGRVEVFFNGAWGTVCDSNWDLNDAHVVCRMLGYGRALRALRGAYFGEGSGDILLDNLACSGSDCTHNGIKSAGCGHRNYASVVCWDDNLQGNPFKHCLILPLFLTILLDVIHMKPSFFLRRI